MSYSRVVALCVFGFVFIGRGVCSQNEDRCGAGFVDCSADGTELCIPHHKVCDGQTDCPGGLDEISCDHSARTPSRVVRKPKSKARMSPPTVAAPTAPAANTTAPAATARPTTKPRSRGRLQPSPRPISKPKGKRAAASAADER
ncbi:hypothetical protein EMCRGX_G008262 [Ephydatia muelleri]